MSSGVRAGAPHQSLDVEDDALTDGALEIVGADLSGDDKVAHEHAVEFAFLVASANDPAREQSPIDLRRSVGVRPLARDQIADESDGLRVDRASPIMGVTKRAAESKDIRAHEQQSRNVRRFERARQAADEVERAALRAELVKPHDIEMRDETAARLVARVEHRALEAERREFGEESEVGLFVGEHHADEADVARQPAQGIAETIERRRVHRELDVVDAHRRERPRAGEQRFFVVRRIAERRARLASPRDGGDRLARGIERNGPERAPPRVFQIDDVGPELQDDVGLGGVGDTGEHARHRVASRSVRSPKVPSHARSLTPNGVKSDAIVEVRRLDWPQAQSYLALKRKRKCMLRSAPFSRLRLWSHWRRRRSLNPARKADPDWPCQQIKTPTFSLASVWAGPQLDLNSQSWRDESDVADLKAKMAQRRVPIADVEKAIADFKAKAGADADAKLLRAFAAAFEDLSQQRSQIIDGLDRFGRKQNALADRIRAENEAVQKSSDQKSDGQAPPGADSQEQLQWDIRVFNDRRQTVTYVCEVPTLIEQRIGEIARAVQKAL